MRAVALAGGLGLPIFAEQMIRFRTADGLRRVAATGLAVLYLGIGAAAMLSIRMTWGMRVLVVFLAAVKCTDMAAYFVGSADRAAQADPLVVPGQELGGAGRRV